MDNVIEKYDFDTHVLVHRRALWLYALRLCRGSRAFADEVVQEAVARALENWASFCPEGDPIDCARGWMYRITYRIFVDEFHAQRKTNKWLETRGADMMLATLGQTEGVCDPWPMVEDCGLSDQVLAALDVILPAHREIVELVDIAGCSYKQAARQLRLPIGTVMSGLSRGRRALRQLLAEYARTEHGIGLTRDPAAPLRPAHTPRALCAGEAAARLETPDGPQGQADRIDRVVAQDDAPAFLL